MILFLLVFSRKWRITYSACISTIKWLMERWRGMLPVLLIISAIQIANQLWSIRLKSWFFPIKTINKDEELTHDYCFEDQAPTQEKGKCLCGAKFCKKKFITENCYVSLCPNVFLVSVGIFTDSAEWNVWKKYLQLNRAQKWIVAPGWKKKISSISYML